MKAMKTILIVLAIIAIAVFTGTWLFDIIAWVFDLGASAFRFLGDIFNLFGWNNGIIGG